MRDTHWHLEAIQPIDFTKPIPQNQVKLKLEFFDLMISLGCLDNAITGIQPASAIAASGQSLGYHLARIEAAPASLRRELYPPSPVPFGGRMWPSYHEAVVDLASQVIASLMDLARKDFDVQQLANRKMSEAFRKLLQKNCDDIRHTMRHRLFSWDASELGHLLGWERGIHDARSKTERRDANDQRMRKEIREAIETLGSNARKKTAIAKLVKGKNTRKLQLIDEVLAESDQSSEFPEPGTKRTRRDK
jgi:hypothetical protein